MSADLLELRIWLVDSVVFASLDLHWAWLPAFCFGRSDLDIILTSVISFGLRFPPGLT